MPRARATHRRFQTSEDPALDQPLLEPSRDLTITEDSSFPSADDIRRKRLEATMSPAQRAIAGKILDQVMPMTREESAIMAGLPPEIVSRVKQITKSVAFHEYLELLGAGKEFLAHALLADIIQKPGSRIKELSLLSALHGLTGKPTQINAKTVNIDQSISMIRAIVAGEELPTPQILDASSVPIDDDEDFNSDHMDESEDDEDDDDTEDE